MARMFTSEGFVLGRRDYGEADRIITLFTKERGKVTFVAKGVRRLTSRKRGSLEIFTRTTFSYAESGGFPILTEAVTIDDYSEFRGSLAKVSLAYYFMEIVSRITREEEKNEQLYVLIGEYMSLLKRTGKLKDLKTSFVYDVLVLMGFWPEGKEIFDPDMVLEEVLERKLSSERVGKKVLE